MTTPHEVAYDYTEPIDPNLTCAICRSALVAPVTTTSCKHTFCRDCITTSIQVKAQCPIDRSVLTLGGLRDTEMLVKLMLDELKVRCAAEGCGQVMQRGLLLGHLRTCQKTVVTCDDGECGLSMARHRLSHHRAYECFQRKMECGKCGTLLLFKDQTMHANSGCNEVDSASRTCELCGEKRISRHTHAWTCPAVRMPCTYQSRGCSALIQRQDLAKHLESCPFEALSSFFASNDARLKSLDERNDRLERDLRDLRTEFEDFRRTLSFNADGRDSVRRAVAGGGGGMMDDFGFAGEGERARASLVRALGVDGSPLTSNPTDMATLHGENNDQSAEGTVQATFDDPTAFRIPVDARPTPAQAALRPDPTPRGPTRSVVAPSFGSHQPYADWAFNRLATDNNATNANLEQVVERLKRVVVHLAAGLDTMERRNEVRSMTESLRVLEEVGTLRAIVTTLRIQVMMNMSPSRRTSFQLSPPPAIPTDHPFSVSSQAIAPWEPSAPFANLTPHDTSADTSEREGSIRESVLPSRRGTISGAESGSLTAQSSTYSLVSTASASAGRSRSGRWSVSINRGENGRTGRSGAGLTGRPMAFPPGETSSAASGSGSGSGSGSETGNSISAGHRLSRANPMNLLHRRPSRLGRARNGGSVMTDTNLNPNTDVEVGAHGNDRASPDEPTEMTGYRV